MTDKFRIRLDHAAMFLLVAFAVYFFAFDATVAFAQGWTSNQNLDTSTFGTGLKTRANSVWKLGRTVFYTVCGLGILVCAVLAVFGRFKWSHLFALIGGVVLVAAADLLISFLGGNGSALTNLWLVEPVVTAIG